MLEEAAKEAGKAREVVQQAQRELKEAEELKAQVVSSIAEEEAGQGQQEGRPLPSCLSWKESSTPATRRSGSSRTTWQTCWRGQRWGQRALWWRMLSLMSQCPVAMAGWGTGGAGSKAPATLEAAGAKVAGQAGEAGLGMPGGRGSRRSASRSRSLDGRLGSLKEKLRKWHSKPGGPSPLSNCRLPRRSSGRRQQG